MQGKLISREKRFARFGRSIAEGMEGLCTLLTLFTATIPS